eukprot:253938-Rhodomonas_salina.2
MAVIRWLSTVQFFVIELNFPTKGNSKQRAPHPTTTTHPYQQQPQPPPSMSALMDVTNSVQMDKAVIEPGERPAFVDCSA